MSSSMETLSDPKFGSPFLGFIKLGKETRQEQKQLVRKGIGRRERRPPRKENASVPKPEKAEN